MQRLRRSIEAVVAAVALLLLSPVLAAIAIAIRIADPGPILYMAERAGLGGVCFRMFKFRTMRVATAGSRIAAPGDVRIFPLGQLLRRLRLDELPQLMNIVRGEMAFVGPRPEDPWIVERVYSAADRETLNVLPGLTSPGTLYYCRHAEPRLGVQDVEAAYIAGPLRRKLELDREYLRAASAWDDLCIVGRTVVVLLGPRGCMDLRAGRNPGGWLKALTYPVRDSVLTCAAQKILTSEPRPRGSRLLRLFRGGH